MDFPLQKAIIDGLTQPETWGSGLIQIYEALANDFHYARPHDLLLFGDNHDMDRVFTQLGGSADLTQMAMAFILMAPRIPQIYYGTEILMDNSSKPGDHGRIRSDFPGGWKGDSRNGFTGNGMSMDARRMQEYLKKILQYRQGSKALTNGKTRHFVPQDGVYVLARSFEEETVLLLINKNESAVKHSLDRYRELGLHGKSLQELQSGKTVLWSGNLTLSAPGAYIYISKD